MRVANVVNIKNGVVDKIESFGVFEEQLEFDVIEAAEKQFIEEAKKLGFTEDNDEGITEDDLLDDGYYDAKIGEIASVCISWSEI